MCVLAGSDTNPAPDAASASECLSSRPCPTPSPLSSPSPSSRAPSPPRPSPVTVLALIDTALVAAAAASPEDTGGLLRFLQQAPHWVDVKVGDAATCVL